MAIINEDRHYFGPLGNVRFYILNGKNVVATNTQLLAFMSYPVWMHDGHFSSQFSLQLRVHTSRCIPLI